MAAGAAGTLIQGDGYKPSHDGALVYINVDSIDPTLELIGKNGGKNLFLAPVSANTAS